MRPSQMPRGLSVICIARIAQAGVLSEIERRSHAAMHFSACGIAVSSG
jgi:hypothetical protein